MFVKSKEKKTKTQIIIISTRIIRINNCVMYSSSLYSSLRVSKFAGARVPFVACNSSFYFPVFWHLAVKSGPKKSGFRVTFERHRDEAAKKPGVNPCQHLSGGCRGVT